MKYQGLIYGILLIAIITITIGIASLIEPSSTDEFMTRFANWTKKPITQMTCGQALILFYIGISIKIIINKD